MRKICLHGLCTLLALLTVVFASTGPSVAERRMLAREVAPLSLGERDGVRGRKESSSYPSSSPSPSGRRNTLHAAPPLLPVFDQQDILPADRILLQSTLLAAAPACIGSLENLYVRYERNVEGRRGLGGKSTIILRGDVPSEELLALALHEYGHVVDLGCLTGTRRSSPSAFRDGPDVFAMDDPSIGFYRISWATERERLRHARLEDFVSGYAMMGDAYEDFAETFTYYMLQRETFIERAATNAALRRKLAWMQRYFPDPAPAIGLHTWEGTVPWDVTKLPYVWKGISGYSHMTIVSPLPGGEG